MPAGQRRLNFWVIASLMLATAGPAGIESGEIALTFDDAPRAGSRLMTGEQRTAALIESLRTAGVKGAIFFSTAGHIDAAGHERLTNYAAAGHFIANHGFSHQRPGRMGLDGYLEDIRAADTVLRQYDNFLSLFRFPFLDEGRDEAMRDGIRVGLADLGYRNGYVTVDNYDWYLDTLLQRALAEGREVDYEALGQIYVQILAGSVIFYDHIARKALGRSPRHALLLHENDLAAMYVDDLVEELRRGDWTIIPGPEAYDDPIATVVTATLFNNQGRVAAIAAQRGTARIDLVHEAEDEAWLEWLTAVRGVFGAPHAWTPLTSDLVYTSTQSGASHLYLREGVTGHVRQLTTGAGSNNYPVWSPDGTRIAFQSRRDGKLDIWVMDADGGNKRRLTDHPEHDYLPSWSADGRQITFVSWRSGEGDDAQENHVYIMNTDGSGQRRLVHESPGTSAPMVWLPASDMAILTRKTSEQGADLFLVDAGGRVLDRLTDDGRYNGSPAISPDGTRITFYSQLGDLSRLEVMNVDGTGRRVLTQQGRDWYPRWSPDGCWLVFTRSHAEDDSILKTWAVHANDTEGPSLLLSNPGNQLEASWRPDPAAQAGCVK